MLRGRGSVWVRALVCAAFASLLAASVAPAAEEAAGHARGDSGTRLTISRGPEGTIKQSEVEFRFQVTAHSGAAFELDCSLDGAPFSECASPEKYANLAHGPHLFRVRMTDSSGDRQVERRHFKINPARVRRCRRAAIRSISDIVDVLILDIKVDGARSHLESAQRSGDEKRIDEARTRLERVKARRKDAKRDREASRRHMKRACRGVVNPLRSAGAPPARRLP